MAGVEERLADLVCGEVIAVFVALKCDDPRRLRVQGPPGEQPPWFSFLSFHEC